MLMILQEIKIHVYGWGLCLLGYDAASVGDWLHLIEMGSLCKTCSHTGHTDLCSLCVSYVTIE